LVDAKPSKSARKREQQELQSLGEKLLELPEEVRQGLALDERLDDAIAALGRMKSHEAIRRQKQYIGKLMRDVDPEPIRALLAARQADDRAGKRLFARAERWRDELVADAALHWPRFRAEFANAGDEIGRLLGELATASSERDERRLRRELFREIHRTLVAHAPDG
jgi:ribosome-associated protein